MGVHDQNAGDSEKPQLVAAQVLGFLLEKAEKLEEEQSVIKSGLSNVVECYNRLDKCHEKAERCITAQDKRVSSLETAVAQRQLSYDGVLFIEIPNYSKKKAAAMTGTPSFYSDDFYTDRHGYRMCARIYLNGKGVGKGSHLSAFFVIKKGRYDNYLSWPFQQQVTFTLLNQAGKDHLSDAFRPDPTNSSFQKPVKEMNIASGCPMFVAHKVIENPTEGFLRDNKICMRIKVDPPTPC